MTKKLKVVFLGGIGEIGKNMYVVETNTEILIIDAGVMFPEDELLGIDYVIPNIDYLKANASNIKGIFLTHGHDENVGAITDLIDMLPNVKMYGSKFTCNIVREEFGEGNEFCKKITYQTEENQPTPPGYFTKYLSSSYDSSISINSSLFDEN